MSGLGPVAYDLHSQEERRRCKLGQIQSATSSPIRMEKVRITTLQRVKLLNGAVRIQSKALVAIAQYFGQLELLELSFSEIRVNFQWTDAFTNKTIQTSIAYEKAFVLFQIATTQSATAAAPTKRTEELSSRARGATLSKTAPLILFRPSSLAQGRFARRSNYLTSVMMPSSMLLKLRQRYPRRWSLGESGIISGLLLVEARSASS